MKNIFTIIVIFITFVSCTNKLDKQEQNLKNVAEQYLSEKIDTIKLYEQLMENEGWEDVQYGIEIIQLKDYNNYNCFFIEMIASVDVLNLPNKIIKDKNRYFVFNFFNKKKIIKEDVPRADRMIMRGDKVILSNLILDINKVFDTFRQELDYLFDKGYKLSSDS
ncbi:MAG: hypothetical protein LBV69_01125 [Bacteroidales bacterium]|jgi:hypothetical protein|nr:hypothetical protein [Bacteroidales bacterium]